ncbi:MAG: AarF/ABC1/UbiB kinase family protein, partial [Gammaproteobacteria bacterium]|nr:AarF/ABC1/UbiB kinase family protein [Gammaproteobacteria bacterium]
MLSTHDRISNRLAFAIVLAALIIGSSLIVLSDIPPKWHEIPVIGLAGFMFAGVMGFWLLVSILRRGRM